MKRIFITHIAPKEIVMKYHIPAAPVYFSYNLIAGKMFDKVYSILPANISGRKEDFSDEEVETIYSSWRGKKFLHKFAPFVEDLKLFPKIPRRSSVWFYNVNMLTALLIILLRIFKPSVKRYVIILDFTPGAKWNKFLLRLINSSSGIIKLSTSDLFTVKNSCILPGVVPLEGEYLTIKSPITPDFLLSGNLNEQICMLHMLLPAFAKMPNLRLHISGFSGDEEYIKSFTEKYPNIIRYGMLEYDEFLELMHHCPFLLSTRDPHYLENMCNFPSKVIEGLLHNRIIISTIHYVQLEGINYVEVPNTIDAFVTAVLDLSQKSESDLLAYANQAGEVKRRFNNKVWADKIAEIENNSNV